MFQSVIRQRDMTQNLTSTIRKNVISPTTHGLSLLLNNAPTQHIKTLILLQTIALHTLSWVTVSLRISQKVCHAKHACMTGVSHKC